MEISFDKLGAQYRNLSDEKLIEIYKGGGLTETAAIVLKEEMSARGLTETKIESLFKAQHENKVLEYQSTGPKPLPKVWVGFVLAGGLLVAEVFEGEASIEGRIDPVTTSFAFAGLIFALFCVYRFHQILRHYSHGSYKISPEAAAGFHLIPLFNLYWVFKWPLELSRYIKEKGNVSVIPGGIIGLMLLVSLLISRIFDAAVGMACFFGIMSYIATKLRRQLAATNGTAEKNPT